MTSDSKNDLAENLTRIRSEIDACVHCGFCLPTCPTYAELGTEMDSPRGRLYLIRALQESRIQPTEPVLRHLDRCLDCRACETACPSGVEYGHILEHTRAALERVRPRSRRSRLIRWFALQKLLPNRHRLSEARRALEIYQRSTLLGWMRGRGWMRLLPASMQRAESLAPRIHGRPFAEGRALRFDPAGRPRGLVGLFTGCVMDQTMGDTHRATARLLTRHGYAVLAVSGQTCCGALHVHNGDPDTARALLLQNARAFAQAGVDRIIVNSAGCGAQLREAPGLFQHLNPIAVHPLEPEPSSSRANADRPDRAHSGSASAHREALDDLRSIEALARRSIDLTAFLAEVGFQPPRARDPETEARRRVVYDAPCHLHHAQKVTESPLELLRALPGIELLPLTESDMCCGAAGIYNLVQPSLSRRLLERKVDHILASGADVVVTANPGCLIQLEAGLRARDSRIEVRHIADFIDGEYGSSQPTYRDDWAAASDLTSGARRQALETDWG